MMEVARDVLAEGARLVSGGGRHVEKGRGALEGPGHVQGGCRVHVWGAGCVPVACGHGHGA